MRIFRVAARLRHCYYHGLHAIDATPARRRSGVVSHRSIQPARPCTDSLVDLCTGPGWQLRGDLDLGDEELGAILGEELRRKLRVTSTSLWSGSGGSRTPLHRDDVSALVWQCVGRKRFFLVAEKDVEEAVAKGKLPSAVLEGGSESHCRDGSLEDVFGLHEAEPTSARGELALLNEGDCLILPAGLYHDVESSDGPSMSLTIRFEIIDEAEEEPAIDLKKLSMAGKSDLKKFVMRLALKKAMAAKKAAGPVEEPGPVEIETR